MNIKQSYLYFFSASAVAIVLRTLLLSFAIDSKSGFIKSEYSIMAAVILIVILAAAIMTFIFSFITKAVSNCSIPGNALFKIISLLLGAVILYDTLFSTMEYSVSSWQKTLELITAILAAVSLISFVILNFLNAEYPKMFSIAPIFFWLIRLVIIFTSFSSLANIVDNIFELAALCMILISSLQVSKTVCTQIEEKKQTQNFALLLTTAFICFVTSIPRVIVSLTGYAAMLHVNDLPIMTTLIAGIYFTVFAISCYNNKREN